MTETAMTAAAGGTFYVHVLPEHCGFPHCNAFHRYDGDAGEWWCSRDGYSPDYRAFLAAWLRRYPAMRWAFYPLTGSRRRAPSDGGPDQ